MLTTHVNTAEKKRRKYRLRIASLLATEVTTGKELERFHGCLNYVAGVESFERPFQAHLTMAMPGMEEGRRITPSQIARWDLRIWDFILGENKGISMDFIVNRVPRHSDDIFDASSSWGIGGCCGKLFFAFP